MNKALFLDRDGTIIKEIESDDPERLGYLTDAEQIKLLENSADAISLARELGYKIIVVTNQSVIARGWLTEEELHVINNKMFKMLMEKNSGAVIDDLYYSPFHIEGTVERYSKDSPFRKPGTGMLMEAKKKHDIDLSASYMIGDSYTDMLCGVSAGTKNILVMTGYGKIAYRKCLDENLKIDFIADNLFEAVKFIRKNAAAGS